MATINLGKVITNEQKAVLDKQSYDSVNDTLDVNADLTANSIVENMEGYSFTKDELETIDYVGVCKNGNKLTLAIAGTMTLTEATTRVDIGYFTIPNNVGMKLYPIGNTIFLSYKEVPFYSSYNTNIKVNTNTVKNSNAKISVATYPNDLVLNTTYSFRYEITFLLSDNLAA